MTRSFPMVSDYSTVWLVITNLVYRLAAATLSEPVAEHAHSRSENGHWVRCYIAMYILC